MAQSLEWNAYNRKKQEHTPDWYWAVAIIALSLVITSILLKNILFAIFIVISTLSLFLRTLQDPKLFKYELTGKGIHSGKVFYPYRSLDSFFVEEEAGGNKIIIKQQALISTYLIIPLGDTNPELVREFLLNHLIESEHHEPLSKKIMEYLGF